MDNTIRSCAIILPLFNEEKSVQKVINELLFIIESIPQVQFEIICVNDGSTDQTEALLNQFKNIKIITHKINRGYGASLKTGIQQTKAEWIFIADADSTYPLKDLPLFFKALDQDIAMVVGARQGEGIVANPLRRLARWTLRRMVHILTGVMVPDLNSGMRLFKRSLYQRFHHLLPNGFSFTSTITVACLHSGFEIKYLPIDYKKRVGQSNIRPINDFIAFTILIIRLVSYFEPLRFFTPLSLGLLLLGFLKALRDIFVVGSVGGLSIILLTVALQIFVTGLLADVIVRRSLISKDPSDHNEYNS